MAAYIVKLRLIMTFEEFTGKFNISLNEQQTEAAKTINGPCLLLAVPGSGKTTVLVTRLGYMIYGCGIDPADILTLTYTVAATKDMSARFEKIFGKELGDRLEFRTINGVCDTILSYYSRKINRPKFDLEADESARIRRISQLYQQHTHQYPTESDVQEISSYITYAKNMMLSEKEIDKLAEKCEYPFKDIYSAYKTSMRNDTKIDYDDQLIYAYQILMSDPDTLAYFRNKYRYICVDEAQDTSKIQHMVIALLAGKNGNLFMVGDEDQSIYGFRAAFPEALLNFEKDHPGAKVLLMEENFRSNANIVYVADYFIRKNRLRHEKDLRPYREAGSEVRKININNRSDQYDHILQAAQTGTETAVLYRDNESVIPLVDLFNRNNIPFRIKNAELGFFSHKVVLDIIAILKFILNECDAESFLRIYYKLNIYLNKNDAMAIVRAANGGNIIAAGMKMKFENSGTSERFVDFVSDIRHLKDKKPGYVLNYIENTMGYGDYLRRMHIGTGKLDILKSIFRNTNTIEESIRRIDEIRDIIRDNPNNYGCKMIFSTIHSSKGLEYDTVYILDAIDGIFPEKAYASLKYLSKEEQNEYEESRRVFYVGITRAKNNLIVFKSRMGSTFVDELRLIKKMDNKSKEELSRKLFFKSVKPALQSVDYKTFCNELVEGRVVMHKKFGKGVVVSVKPPFVDIQFESFKKSLNIEVMAKNGLLKAL